MNYCNITTDLQRVFSRIEDYQAKEIIENWTLHLSNRWKKQGTGYLEKLWVDELAYTLTDTAAVDEEEFYYDADKDVLYIHITGDTDPNDSEIYVGEDWDTYKTAMRDKAQQIIDSYLNGKYATPLVPRNRKTHDDSDYEYPIVQATALCTCWLIINRVEPNDISGKALYKQFYNPMPEPGEVKGIINQLIDGELVLQDQISAREVGCWNIFPNPSNSVDSFPIFSGIYTGSQYKIWRLQVDTAGAPGTGTWKVSYDGGTTWDLNLKDMKNATNDQYRMSIADGIYVYWPNVSYGDGDYWDIELHPLSDTATNVKIFSIRAVR